MLSRRRPRPARPGGTRRPAGPRAGAPVLVELTNHYTVRDGRIYRDAILRAPDGSTFVRYVPQEFAA